MTTSKTSNQAGEMKRLILILAAVSPPQMCSIDMSMQRDIMTAFECNLD